MEVGQEEEVEATTNKGAKAIKEPKKTKENQDEGKSSRGRGRGISVKNLV